jgi:CHAT domain-containing protein
VNCARSSCHYPSSIQVRLARAVCLPRSKFAVPLAFLVVCALAAPQQPAAQTEKPADAIPKAREALKAAEAAHPGNTVDVAQALDDLVGAQLDAELANDETIALVNREAAVSLAASGPRGKAYITALGTTSEVYVATSQAAKARPYAEQAFEIAEKDFPDTEEGIHAADELAYVCRALGDLPCALHANEVAIATERKTGGNDNFELVGTLSNLGDLKDLMGDYAGAGAALEEALAVGLRVDPKDPHLGVIENNLGAHYIKAQEFAKALPHLNRAIEIDTAVYGADSPMVQDSIANLADLYNRSGQYALAWRNYEIAIGNTHKAFDMQAQQHAVFARSLAAGGNLTRALDEALISARMSRETLVLQIRTLPERQALAYDRLRPHPLETAISVLTRHPELPADDVYQEMVRSRALVADEMARRQKNLNAQNDAEIARQLEELNQARSRLLAVEATVPGKSGNADEIAAATDRMEKIERALAERSAAIRSDERIAAVRLEDVRRNLPPQSVLISYVAFQRRSVEKVDPALSKTPSYMAFVLHPDSNRIRIVDLGTAKPIDELITRARAAADAEAHSGGLGSIRNERAYRQAGLELRRRIWDPLQNEIGSAKLALVVPDGNLNLIPFAGLPSGNGYLVERGPVIHTLSSERDLVPGEGTPKKTGLLAIGSPRFDLAVNSLPPSPLRDAPVSCDEFRSLQFHPLPGSAQEVTDIDSTWRRWNRGEASSLLTGADATRSRFLEEAARNRVLHVATHAFVLDKSCGDGNPLLHSGLVFAGANEGRESSILTAQQIASLDLGGVDWAVLSACNTGNGVLQDGEGVLGLERAFRVAGAHSVVMALWPVDDTVTRRFMHELYEQRLVHRASTADAVWNSSRMLLLERRAQGKSTHPWYWAGFVGSGGWE